MEEERNARKDFSLLNIWQWRFVSYVVVIDVSELKQVNKVASTN